MDTNLGCIAKIKSVISVVEDDSLIRASIVDLLDSANYQSMNFTSSEQFISAHAAEKSDLIITDVHLGEISGLDLLQWLIDNEYSKVPVIVITALADETLELRAIDKGCYAFLRKPFELDKLINHIKDALSLSDREYR